MQEFNMTGEIPGVFYLKKEADEAIKEIQKAWKMDQKSMEMQRRKLQQVEADNTRMRDQLAELQERYDELNDFNNSQIKNLLEENSLLKARRKEIEK